MGKEDKALVSSVKGVVCGAVTGGLEICITYPIKYVKTQLQLEEKFGSQRQYKGMMDCFRSTVRSHGIPGLYRGLNIFLYAPRSAIRFGGFELMKTQLMDENGNLSGQNKFLCGLCAGVVEAAIITTPLETVEVKLINDQRTGNPRYKGYFHGARIIIKENGIRGIYQGFYPSIIKQGSNQGIRFFVVESLRSWHDSGNSSKSSPIVTALFGAVAGFCSVVGNNPIDVIKTRMQGLDAAKYNNFIDCFTKIWIKEGPLGFYRGITPRLSRVCLEVALTFLIYDLMQDLFRAIDQSRSS